MAHKTLKNANRTKKDEFYTQLSDIEKELKHYKSQFKDKVVYCNADDPFESNFFKYFASNFNVLRLKKLIATSYIGSSIVGKQLSIFDIAGVKNKKKKEPMKIEINEVKDFNNDKAVNLLDIEYLLTHDKNSVKPLEESGDFRSKECVEFLKEADIVVTNPPFSLFRDFVAQLVEHNKKYLIIGNTNAITYKEIFKLIKEDKIRTGYTNFNVGMFFVVPDDWEKYHHIDENGKKIARVSTSCWFTNLEVKKHKEDLILFKTYEGNEDEYPKYDNYDSIEVSKVATIPIDYKECMGVPITFLDKHNPDQFEIIGFTHRNDPYELKTKVYTKEDGSNFNDLNGSPIIKEGNKFRFIYMRIIIRNKRLKK